MNEKLLMFSLQWKQGLRYHFGISICSHWMLRYFQSKTMFHNVAKHYNSKQKLCTLYWPCSICNNHDWFLGWSTWTHGTSNRCSWNENAHNNWVHSVSISSECMNLIILRYHNPVDSIRVFLCKVIHHALSRNRRN